MKRAIAVSAALFCLAVPGGSALASGGDYPPGDPGTSGGGPTPAGNPAPPADRQELPSTGSSADDMLRLGGITLVAGAGLVAVTRRRRPLEA